MEHILNSRRGGKTYAMLLELKAAIDATEATKFLVMCPTKERSALVYKLAQQVFDKSCIITREVIERSNMTDVGIFDSTKQYDFYVIIEKRMT